MSLSSLFYLYSNIIYKYQNWSLIQEKNIRRTLLTNQIIVSKVASFFSSNPKNFSYFIHRSSIERWIKRWSVEIPIFFANQIQIKGSNPFFLDMSVLYRKKNINSFFWKNFSIKIVVERVPCFYLDFKPFSFNPVNGPHYWLIENQSIFTNDSRNAMVLKYDWFISWFRSNSRNHAPFSS